MQENKNLVEEALIQMKNVEEAIAENAKGILASTMKEEINQLVKESLSEQDDDEMDVVDTDVEVDTDVDTDTDNEDDVDMDIDMDIDTDSDETPIDLTGASDEEILKVFKAMGEEDGIIIKKDGSDVTLKDSNTDSEYLIKLGESIEEEYENMMEYNEEDETTQDVIDAIFSNQSDEEEMDETIYEIEMDEDDSMEMEETIYEIEMDEESEEDESMEMDEESEEDESMEMDEESEEDESMEMDEDDSWQMDEAYSHKKAKKGMKPKGLGIGKPKFQYKKTSGGFKEDKKEGPKSVGTGKPKFEYKEGKNLAGKNKIVKKVETKESSRTLGMGSDFRKGGLPKPRAHSKANTAIKESLETEVTTLREKNEEYRKALNTFREKLNEVAIFNSNLAYATRLFTEHSTTKKEKINILRRFDGVETLKESKNLYKSIKDELGKVESKPMNESVETKLNKNVSTGSSSILIESKTYENPQFLRIKDLMGKIV
jgi:predicted HNH restriction endonuclease